MASIFTTATVDDQGKELSVHCTDANTGITMKVMVPLDAMNEDTRKSVGILAANMPEAFLRGVMMIAEGPDAD
jgi:hypothetical protein